MAKKHEPEARTLPVQDPAGTAGKLKRIGGSVSDEFNSVLAHQAIQTLGTKYSDSGSQERQMHATIDALIGIGPRDELEGMLAAQMVALHNASMECLRRAMLGEQTFEGRRENLNQANKLSRTYATLLEALNRHRGKGQQKVTVEHVHVHPGGQAIVGSVTHQGGGGERKDGDQPHAQALAHAPQPALRSQDPQPEPVPLARDAEREVPHARRRVSGRTPGQGER
jgi:hypothetical protein